MNEYIMAWDIAQKRDYTTGIVARRRAEIHRGDELLKTPDRVRGGIDIVAIDQFNNLPYNKVSDAIKARMGHRDLANNCDLIVDGTGVGAAVVDLLRERGLKPIPIVFTAGGTVREVTSELGSVFRNEPGKLSPLRVVRELHVPKADLVAAGRLIFEQGRIRIADLPLADQLRNQLVSFRGKVNEKGNTRFEAATEADHDDMVVCILMLAWWSARSGTEERVIPQAGPGPEWAPADYW